MKEKASLILTGSEGFIGSAYTAYLGDSSSVFLVDRKSDPRQDLNNKEFVSQLPECDVLVHMAATNGTEFFYSMPFDVASNNTIPILNLVERYQDTKTKFVFASTCEIFNGATDEGIYSVPTDENVPIIFRNINNPRWSYSLPKALGENVVINSGLSYLILRYFNVYGPSQTHHFVNEFVERAASGDYFIIGNDTRSFCFVDDAIEMTASLVRNQANQVVNVGNPTEMRIADVAKIILDLMGIDPNRLEIRPGLKGSAKRRCPDTRLVQSLTGFKNYTPLKVGLRKTIEALI